jgi:hypothetical protein
MMHSKALEALEKEQDRRGGKEEIPAGLQKAIKKTQEAIGRALSAPEIYKATSRPNSTN